MRNAWHFIRTLIIILKHPFETIDAIKSIKKVNKTLVDSNTNIVFFDRYAMHYGFSEPIFKELTLMGLDVLFIVSDKDHCQMKSN